MLCHNSVFPPFSLYQCLKAGAGYAMIPCCVGKIESDHESKLFALHAAGGVDIKAGGLNDDDDGGGGINGIKGINGPVSLACRDEPYTTPAITANATGAASSPAAPTHATVEPIAAPAPAAAAAIAPLDVPVVQRY